jgi:excisionase family DNA binding protein
VQQSDVATPVSVREMIAKHDGAMTADQVAAVLNVSPITVYKQAKAGKIPSFRIGTCVRFCPKTVAGWLDKQ